MTADQLINVLVTITLIAMMAAVDLGVTFRELTEAARNWRLLGRAASANYVCVPAVTVYLNDGFQVRSTCDRFVIHCYIKSIHASG